MPRRITKAFFAAAAAGATITTLGLAASPAGAAAGGMHFTPSAPEVATDAHGTPGPVCGAPADITGTWSTTDCGKAGYVATGRNFRFASALVTVPNHTGLVATRPDDVRGARRLGGEHGLRPGGRPAVHARSYPRSQLHLLPSAGASGWQAFAMVDESGVITVGDRADLAASVEGDGVFLSVYLVPTGQLGAHRGYAAYRCRHQQHLRGRRAGLHRRPGVRGLDHRHHAACAGAAG